MSIIFEKVFLNQNRENNYDYYATLDDKRYYCLERQVQIKEIRLLEIEKLLLLRNLKVCGMLLYRQKLF